MANTPESQADLPPAEHDKDLSGGLGTGATPEGGPSGEVVGPEARPIRRTIDITHGGRIGGHKSPFDPTERYYTGSAYAQSAHSRGRAIPFRAIEWTRPVRRMSPERADYSRVYRTGSFDADVKLVAGPLRRGRPKGAGIKGLIGGAPSRPRRMRPIRKTPGKGGKRKAARVAGIAGGLAHNSTVREAGW